MPPQTEYNAPSAWRQINRPARGKPKRVEFHFSPEYVRVLWKPRAAQERTERGEYAPREPERLLLDDVVSVRGSSMFVRAWLIPARQAEYYHMRVEIVAPPSVTRNLRVILHWDGHRYVAVVRAGTVLFEDISPPDFSRFDDNVPSRELRLSIEFEGTGSNGGHH